jgi:hypothetical protein
VVDGGVTWTCAADTVAFSSGVFTSSIDCSGSTVGNKVYLGASGIIQLAAPSAIDTIVQEIGRVKTIVNPGVISGRICAPIKMGTSWLQTDAALPSQTGNTGKVLQTNGTVSSWQTSAAGTVTSVTGTAPIVSSGSSTPAISLGPLINTGEVVNIIGNTGSSGVAMNFQSGNVVTATSTGNTTWSITNPKAAGTATTLSLILTNGGAYVQTWMSGINWGVTGAPTLQTSGINILRFTSVDGGSTWLGALAF